MNISFHAAAKEIRIVIYHRFLLFAYMTGTINTLGIINPIIAPIAIVISVSTSILQSSWAEIIEVTKDNTKKPIP